MSKKVYIVKGVTGEYSDHKNWVVGTFASKDLAETVVLHCQQWAQDRDVLMNSKGRLKGFTWNDLSKIAKEGCPYDAKLNSIDYTGVDWYLEETNYYDE